MLRFFPSLANMEFPDLMTASYSFQGSSLSYGTSCNDRNGCLLTCSLLTFSTPSTSTVST
jgi:hypothetical protein